MTALERYNTFTEGETMDDPIERLRFFLSLALIGQDWLDVEPFIDDVSNQLASRDAEIAELKAELETERCLSFRNQVADLESERNKLLDQVVVQKKAIDALVKVGTTVAPSSSFWEEEWVQHEEALAATEPK